MDDVLQRHQVSQPNVAEGPDSASGSGIPVRRPIVMVLGMHRSGTSLCSHMLSMLGVDMADEITPGRGNEKGHWERWEIVAFHDQILEHFGRAYASPLHDLPLPPAWWADPYVANIRQQIAKFIEPKINYGLFGFKDPRSIRLLPLWHQICETLHLLPKIILCVRNPVQVSRSLHARDQLDRVAGEYRWLTYTADFLRYAAEHRYCLIEYESWFNNPRANVDKLLDFLGFTWQQRGSDLDLVLNSLIDPELRHDPPETRDCSLPLVQRFYEFLLKSEHDDDARHDLSDLLSQFVAFQQTQQPLQHNLERSFTQASRLPLAEQQVADLQACIAQEEVVTRATRGQLEQIAVALDEAHAEAERARSHVSQLEAELISAKKFSEEEHRQSDELMIALTNLEKELEAKRQEGNRLQEVARATDELTHQLSVRDKTVAQLQDSLDQDRQKVEELSEALSERNSALETALAERDAAEDTVKQQLSILESIKDDRQRLRDAVSLADRISGELHDKIIKLEAECEKLRNEKDENWLALSAARQEIARYKAALEEEAAEAEKQYRELSSELDIFRGRAIEHELERRETERNAEAIKASMQRALNEAIRERDRNQRALKSTQDWAAGLRKRFQLSREALAQAELRAFRDAELMAEAMRDIEALNERITTTDDAYRRQIGVRDALLDEKDSQIAKATAALAERDAALAEGKNEIAELRNRLDQSASEMQRAIATAAALRAAIGEQKNANEAVSKESDLIRDQLAAARRINLDVTNLLRAERAKKSVPVAMPKGLFTRLRDLVRRRGQQA